MNNGIRTKRMKALEARLTQAQIRAAKLLAINDFLPGGARTMNEEERLQARAEGRLKLTLEDIADQAGCSTKQLYTWRRTHDEFIEYVNTLSTITFMSNLPEVMNKHLEMVLKGHGSMKGIELFYKFGGLLVDKQEVSTKDEGNDSATLEERLAKLQERVGDKENEED